MGSSSDSSSNQNNSTEKEIDSIKLIDVVIKRISYTFIGCIIVLAILFLIIISIVPNDKINIAFSFNDAFIGVIATLIGIMVTFVIGYQILNALQIKKEMSEYKDIIKEIKLKSDENTSNVQKCENRLDKMNTFHNDLYVNMSSILNSKSIADMMEYKRKLFIYVEKLNNLSDSILSRCDIQDEEVEKYLYLFEKYMYDLFIYGKYVCDLTKEDIYEVERDLYIKIRDYKRYNFIEVILEKESVQDFV